MKKLHFFILTVLFSETINSQNIQLHYDFGKGRKYFTSTVEMFKPDKYGSTFFFIDMDYNSGGIKGISMAYWELARAIKFWEKPMAFHIEYNGGLGQWHEPAGSMAYTINDSWLGGIEFSRDSKDYSKGFTIQALYKYIRGKHNASFQITGVWYLYLAKNKLSFNGFADFWREDMAFQLFDGTMETTRFVFQTEPQIWFNIFRFLAIGSETELSCNFAGRGFKAMPTLGMKATF